MVKSFLTIFFLLHSISYKSDIHPIHLSVTTVEYNESIDEYAIMLRIFTDDLETIISKRYNVELNLAKENEHLDSRIFIMNYLQERLIISINNKNLLNHIEFVRKEHEINENVTFLYFRTKNHNGKKVNVTNILLTDLYDNQKNLLIFTYKNTQEAFTFEKNKTNFEFYIR